MKKLDKCRFEPKATNSNISDNDLKILLSLPTKKYSFFCWHDWIVWRYGGVSKFHRVCKKCHKKQISQEVVPRGDGYINWTGVNF